MQYRTALPALIRSLFYSLGIYTVPLRCVSITTFVSLLAQQVGVSTLNFFSQRLVFVTASLRLRDRPRAMINNYVQTLNRNAPRVPALYPLTQSKGAYGENANTDSTESISYTLSTDQVKQNTVVAIPGSTPLPDSFNVVALSNPQTSEYAMVEHNRDQIPQDSRIQRRRSSGKDHCISYQFRYNTEYGNHPARKLLKL